MKTNNTIYVVVGLGLVLCVLAYFVGKSIGVKSPPPAVPLPDDNNPGGTGAPITNAEQGELDSLALRIYNDVTGISWWGHDNDLYQECINLSDRLLGGLYNTYNAKYFSRHNQTLTQVLNDEYEPFGEQKIFALRDKLIAKGWR